MIGLTAARTERERQQHRTQRARQQVGWWQDQTRAAARKAIRSPKTLLAAVAVGWWVGRRAIRGRRRVQPRSRVNWQSIRQTWLQIVRLWTLSRGLQVALTPVDRHLAARKARPRSDSPARSHPGPAYRGGQIDGL